MLYGIHVYARAKVVPDLMLSRGIDAYRTARMQGDRMIEFLAAGGVALANLQLDDAAEVDRWLGLAAAALASAPSPIRARQLETWRGLARAAAGDAEGMRRHLEGAVAMATEQGRAAARCDALARLALEAARLGVATPNTELLELAERSAAQAKGLAAQLPGHASWGARADAALSIVALSRGDVAAAVSAGGAVLQALQDGAHEDLDLDIVIPATRAIFAGAPEDVQRFVRTYLEVSLARIAQGTLDEAIRVRWLRGPVGRELAALVGAPEPAATATDEAAAGSPATPGADLEPSDRRLLRHLTEGLSNREIAAELGITEEEVATQLAQLFARLGTSSRAEATIVAFRGLAPVGAG